MEQVIIFWGWQSHFVMNNYTSLSDPNQKVEKVEKVTFLFEDFPKGKNVCPNRQHETQLQLLGGMELPKNFATYSLIVSLQSPRVPPQNHCLFSNLPQSLVPSLLGFPNFFVGVSQQVVRVQVHWRTSLPRPRLRLERSGFLKRHQSSSTATPRQGRGVLVMDDFTVEIQIILEILRWESTQQFTMTQNSDYHPQVKDNT